jgi:NitT/TauT family transport system substrate-binding protein
VRIAQTGDFPLYVGLYVAKDAGIFARNGLDASIISTGGDQMSAAAVLSGHAEFSIGDPTFAAIADTRGQKLRFFASIVNGAPFWGITFKDDVAARFSRSGLKGLTVATFPAPSTAYALQRDMFESAGLKPQIREGAFGSLQGILESGKADIALELEPNVSVAQKRGAKILYSMAQRVSPFTVTGALVSADYATAHPMQVKAFCASLDSAFKFIREKPEEADAILFKRFPEVPPEVIRSAIGRSVQENVIPGSASIDPKGWERALMLRASVGDLSNVTVGREALDQTLCAPSAGRAR